MVWAADKVLADVAVHSALRPLCSTHPIQLCPSPPGLKFFPAYLSDSRREAIDETALAVQRLGYSQLRRLKPGSQPPLLPAPEGAVPLPVPVPAADGSLAVPPTDQRRALGAVHVCEHAECESLPWSRLEGIVLHHLKGPVLPVNPELMALPHVKGWRLLGRVRGQQVHTAAPVAVLLSGG